ncbi:M23 family metallopeptidase [Georgenia halophila]
MTCGTAVITTEPAGAAPRVAIVPSVLGVLDAADASVRTPDALAADPTSHGRAQLQAASRADAREALPDESAEGADGAAAAVTDPAQVAMPLAAGTFRHTSDYGPRSNPIGGGAGMHTGTDFSAPLGTPIHSIADGVVTHVGEGIDGRSSMLIIVEHEIDGETVESWYNHMYSDGIHVKTGQKVDAGQVIAEVGNNGYSTGPHLHLEIHPGTRSETVDPLPWLEAAEAVDVSDL